MTPAAIQKRFCIFKISGAPHHVAEEKNASGAIRGLDKSFLMATVIRTPDLPRWLAAYGSSDIRPLVESVEPYFKDRVLQALEDFESMETLRDQMLATTLPCEGSECRRNPSTRSIP
jgi:hypothetical protein